MLRSARSFDPVPIGIAFLVLVAVLMYFAFNLGRIPLLGGGQVYSAAFSEAAGLRSGNDVMVGGVKVGEVRSVSLEGTEVHVEFTVDGARVGDDPALTIGIGTLLGNKFLALQPRGAGTWDPDELIPLSRTTAPYDIVPAFADLTETVAAIDTEQLAAAFTTLADTFRDAPPHVRGALDGLTRMSATISSRDEALSRLLGHAQEVTGVLADRRTEITALMGDGSLLLRELDARQDAISALLVGTAELSAQLEGLVDDNQATIGPALAELAAVTSLLVDNQGELEKFLDLLYPTVRALIDTVGNGPWFDGILGGMTFLPQVPGLTPVLTETPQTLAELLGVPSEEAP